MEQLNFNCFLKRENIARKIKEFLINFEKNKKDISIKRGIYIYGESGTGKTHFIKTILKESGYDIINYNTGDIRNKSIIDTINHSYMPDKNIMALLKKEKKPLAIIMDEIDGMNNGDKGGINSLIKIIRPKKTKKQKLEEMSNIPIICIGNNYIDKKINELIKICEVFVIDNPLDKEICNIINITMPFLSNDKHIVKVLVNYIQNDLRKLIRIYEIYKKDCDILKNDNFLKYFQEKSYNENTKEITKKLIKKKYDISHHNTLINETDRTTISLLLHENIIDILNKIDNKKGIILYKKILQNICYGDYIDRITFQKQIWRFNEMTSLIKIFYNNSIFHNNIDKKIKLNIPNIRFTKILTKYSTEYNNKLFIQNLCQILNFDKKDLLAFFIKMREEKTIGQIYTIFEQYDIGKLDINRIYRYIDKLLFDTQDTIDTINTIDTIYTIDTIDNNDII